jgi:hypothetical protein
METATRTNHASEAHDVRAWRFCALRVAGYPSRVAAELAGNRDIDLHAAVDLLARGCPLDTALAILR